MKHVILQSFDQVFVLDYRYFTVEFASFFPLQEVQNACNRHIFQVENMQNGAQVTVSLIKQDGKILKDDTLSCFMEHKRVLEVPVFECGGQLPGYIIFYVETNVKAQSKQPGTTLFSRFRDQVDARKADLEGLVLKTQVLPQILDSELHVAFYTRDTIYAFQYQIIKLQQTIKEPAVKKFPTSAPVHQIVHAGGLYYIKILDDEQRTPLLFKQDSPEREEPLN